MKTHLYIFSFQGSYMTIMSWFSKFTWLLYHDFQYSHDYYYTMIILYVSWDIVIIYSHIIKKNKKIKWILWGNMYFFEMGPSIYILSPNSYFYVYTIDFFFFFKWGFMTPSNLMLVPSLIKWCNTKLKFKVGLIY